LRALLEAGERTGVDRAEALAAIGVTPAEVDDPAGWIATSRMARAWSVVPAMSGDPSFGIHAAETTPLGVFGPLDLAAMSSATVGEALARVVRYYASMGAMSKLALTHAGSGALHLTASVVVARRVDHRHFVENLFAVVVTRIRMVIMAAARGELDVSVSFAHAAPADTSAHARVFGARVAFGAKHDELVVGPKTAAMPLLTSNPELSPLLEREGERLALRPDAPIADRVRGALARTMRDGRVGLGDVARALGLGPRSVQRQLQHDGTTFAAVLTAVRRDVAFQTLTDGGSASELTYVLGFSQPSAFYRAFRRWTGTTPTAWTPKPGVKRRPG
jgi:AraC-like DNA-binding protein